MTEPLVNADADVAPKPERHHSIRGAVAWSYVLTVGRFSVSGGVTLLLAFILTPHEFGVMALAMVWVYFAQVLGAHGPAQAVMQRETVTDRHLDAAFWVTTGVGVALAGVFALVAPWWAALNDQPELAPVCRWLAISILLNALFVVPESILRRQLKFRALSVRVLVAGLISGAVAIGVAAAGYGVWALVAQQLVVSAVSAVAIWFVVPWRPTLRRWNGALRDLRRYSLNSVSEFFAYFVATRADALLLGGLFGTVTIGLYRFSVRLTEMVVETASGGLGQISLPDLSRFAAEPAAFAARLSRLLHAGAVVAMPLFGILAAVAQPFLAVLGPEWTPATAGLRVLCLVGASMVLGSILAPALQATGRNGLGAVVGWAEAGVTVAALSSVGWLFADAAASTQVLAIATAFLAVQLCGLTAVLLITFRRLLGVPVLRHLRPVLPALAAGAGAAAVGTGAQTLLGLTGAIDLVTLAATGVIAAATAATLLALLDREMAGRVGRLLRRVRSRVAPAPSPTDESPTDQNSAEELAEEGEQVRA